MAALPVYEVLAGAALDGVVADIAVEVVAPEPAEDHLDVREDVVALALLAVVVAAVEGDEDLVRPVLVGDRPSRPGR